MGSYGWHDGPPPQSPAGWPPSPPPGQQPYPYGPAGAPYHPPVGWPPPYPYGQQYYPYGPPPPGPKRRREALAVAAGVGVPLLALILIGIIVVVVARGDTARPSWFATLTQAAAIDASVESYWSRTLSRETGTTFRPARVEHFSGRSSSTCRRPPGALEAFYCPRDETIFISTEVYPALTEASIDVHAAAFARAMLLAHEYGHHVQFLTGSIREVSDTGHDVARLELQADCYAGLWAHAVWRSDTPVADPLAEAPRSDDIDFTFGLIGDVTAWDPNAATTRDEIHGSAEQREAWFMSGYVEGDLAACDTSENVGPDGFPS